MVFAVQVELRAELRRAGARILEHGARGHGRDEVAVLGETIRVAEADGRAWERQAGCARSSAGRERAPRLDGCWKGLAKRNPGPRKCGGRRWEGGSVVGLVCERS